MRIAVSSVLLAVMLSGPALAQAPAPAKPIPHKPPSLMEQAQSGDALAQYQIGMAYLRGKGVRGIRRNAAEGISWLALAAAGGSRDAAARLAEAYESGIGVKKDAEEAARWWFRAGKLGDEAARERFVGLFLAGQTEDDLGGSEVAQWLDARVQAGDAEAILGLAGMYEHGRGLPADSAEAERWYLKLALDGNAEAQFRLGRMLLQRPAMWRLPEKEFRDDEWTGAVWYSLKPQGENKAQLMRPGMVAGERWLRAAAERGHAEAQYTLAMIELAGIQLPFDLEDSIRWLQAAAEQNHKAALIAIADLAANGHGFRDKDPIRSWVYYDLAAQVGAKDGGRLRDMLAATMSARQLARARQLAQQVRDLKGM